jgi:hypothetical protein
VDLQGEGDTLTYVRTFAHMGLSVREVIAAFNKEGLVYTEAFDRIPSRGRYRTVLSHYQGRE